MIVQSYLFEEPLFGIAITVLMYLLALKLHGRWKWLHPLFVTSVGLIIFLMIANIPYEAYKVGGVLIEFFLGPATVALGVPLYKHASQIKGQLLSILGGIILGSISAMVSAGFFVWLFGGTKELMVTMIPKSATTPISIEIVEQLGGQPELGAVLTVLTGLLGSMIGPEILKLTGIKEEIPVGIAIGTSSHGIGTARMLGESELSGSVSGFAMGMTGIITSICAIPLYWWVW